MGLSSAISPPVVACRLALITRRTLSRKGSHILSGRLNQQLAVVLAHILSEEIKPFFNVRDSGFLLREFQPSGLEERSYQRFDFQFQQLFSSAGNNEVIRIANHIHQR